MWDCFNLSRMNYNKFNLMIGEGFNLWATDNSFLEEWPHCKLVRQTMMIPHERLRLVSRIPKTYQVISSCHVTKMNFQNQVLLYFIVSVFIQATQAFPSCCSSPALCLRLSGL